MPFIPQDFVFPEDYVQHSTKFSPEQLLVLPFHHVGKEPQHTRCGSFIVLREQEPAGNCSPFWDCQPNSLLAAKRRS